MKLFCRTALLLLLTSVAAHAVPLTLRVVDADNNPIAGATVEYVDYANIKLNNVTLPAPTTAQTAADGTLALDLRGTLFSENPDAVQDEEDSSRLGVARARVPGHGATNIVLIAGENLLKLRPRAQVQGVVRDANGSPVAGAKVVLRNVENSENSTADWGAGYGLEPLAALTDAQGNWKMEGLAQGYANFIASAPAKVAQKMTLFVGEKPAIAPPLVLPPAGTIKGRILDVEGQPVSGVSVGWDGGYGSYGEQVYSDENGNFALTDAPLDDNLLSFFSDKPDWMDVTEDVTAILAKPGETVDVGEVRASRGVLISGVVRDKSSGAILPDFRVRFGYKILRTDANGRFEGRVMASTDAVALYDDYLSSGKLPAIPADAERFDAGEITVERGIRLRFDLRDEAGDAAPDARVRLQSTNIEAITHQRDSDYDGVSATIWPLPVAQYSVQGLGVWQVIEPKTLSVTATDAETVRTVTVRLRKLEPLRISGRVVDTLGNPIDEADVQIGIVGDDYYNARSRKDGVWQLEVPVKSGQPMLGKVTAPAFQLVGGGALARDGALEANRWKSADIVMARTDIALLGRVTDDKGAPVAGARVSWAGATGFEFAATDAQGNFEIKNVPAVPQIVRASDGPRYVEATATPGAPVSLKLPVAKSLSDVEVEKLWEQLGARDIYRLGDYFDILGAPRIYQAARRADGAANPTQIGEGLSNFLEMRAKRARTPELRADAAIEGVELLRSFAMPSIGGDGAASLAVVAAHTDDAELREWAANWYDSRKPRLPEVLNEANFRDSGLINVELRMADIGNALGRADADKYLADALTLIEKFQGGEKRFYLDGWGAKLWGGDQKRFDKAIASWAPTEQMAAIAGALKSVDNAAEARQLLSQLEKLSDDPAVLAVEAEEKKTDANSWSNRQDWLYQGRIEFARLVAKTDAPSALDVVEKLGNSPDVLFIGAAIARDAMADGQNEIARRALRLGLLTGWSEAKGAPALAMIACPFDVELARQLLDKSKEKVFSEYRGFDFDGQNKGWREVAFYAFALRDFDAGLGRVLLEDQWAKRLKAATAPDAQPADTEAKWARISLAREQSKLARTMASYDVPRALQWLDAIKFESDQSNNDLEYTRLAIIATALAPPAQRPFLLDAYLN